MLVTGPVSDDVAAGRSRPPAISTAPCKACRRSGCHSERCTPGSGDPIDGIERERRQSQTIPCWFVGGTDRGREGAGSAVVAEPGEHVRRRDPVGDAVVNLHQDRPPVVLKAVDDPAFP